MQWTEFSILIKNENDYIKLQHHNPDKHPCAKSQDPSQYKRTIEMLPVTYSGQTLVLEDRVPWTRSVLQWIEEKGAGRNNEISADPEGWSDENQRSEGSAEISFSCCLFFYSFLNKRTNSK
jgi:hypothetical protein